MDILVLKLLGFETHDDGFDQEYVTTAVHSFISVAGSTDSLDRAFFLSLRFDHVALEALPRSRDSVSCS